MQSFALLLHDYRNATLCPPYLVLGLHACVRPHHSIGDGQCAEGSTRVENRECCLVRRSWAKSHVIRPASASQDQRPSTSASTASVSGSQKVISIPWYISRAVVKAV